MANIVTSLLTKTAATAAQQKRGKGGKWVNEGSSTSDVTSFDPTPNFIEKVTERAFHGDPVPVKHELTKQQQGMIGERIVVQHLLKSGKKNARPANKERTNFPVDVAYEGGAAEVKTGLVQNRKDAQKWRITFSTSEKEREAQKSWTPEQIKEYNTRKQLACMERKLTLIADIEKATGKPVKRETYTVLLDHDKGIADVFRFDGYHQIIRWNSDLMKKGYQGSYRYIKPGTKRLVTKRLFGDHITLSHYTVTGGIVQRLLAEGRNHGTHSRAGSAS
jgi:hypothetical protein